MSPSTENVAVVTAVSHRAGIGFAIARQLLDEGWAVLAHGWSAADALADLIDHNEVVAILEELGGVGHRLQYLNADLSEPRAVDVVINRAIGSFGHVDALVVNHATSLSGNLFDARSRISTRPGQSTPVPRLFW